MVHTMKRLQDTAFSAHKPSKRRNYDAAFKRHLVELSLVAGASVARIALDHRLNANMLFKWRRTYLRSLAQAGPKPVPGLLPITVTEPEGPPEGVPLQRLAQTAQRRVRPAGGGVIEIDLPFGRVRLTGTVDPAALRVVIEALSPR